MGSSSPLQAETLEEDYPASGPCRPHLCRCAEQQLSALRGQPRCPRETEAVTGAGDPRLPPTLSVGREAGHLAGGGRGGGDSFLLSLPSPPPPGLWLSRATMQVPGIDAGLQAWQQAALPTRDT